MEYQRCNRCVMDNAGDSNISFLPDGTCNYCNEAIERQQSMAFSDVDREKKLANMLNEIKSYRIKHNNKFDCVMGISGGIDSSYLTHLAISQWKLKVALIHIDDGFNTEITEHNIKAISNKLNTNITVIRPDREQYNNLLVSYFRAGVPNLTAPQDNVLFANIYDFVKKNNLKYFLSGGNFATESILQSGNNHPYLDLVNIKDINKKYGNNKLDKIKFTSFKRKALAQMLNGLKSPRPLDIVKYEPVKAFNELEQEYHFENYGKKHYENYLTLFNQTLWLPMKFGVDKRKSHLSSMIISKQITREEAIEQLREPVCSEADANELIEIVAKKIGITSKEIVDILNTSGKQHRAFRTDLLFELYKILQK